MNSRSVTVSPNTFTSTGVTMPSIRGYSIEKKPTWITRIRKKYMYKISTRCIYTCILTTCLHHSKLGGTLLHKIRTLLEDSYGHISCTCKTVLTKYTGPAETVG